MALRVRFHPEAEAELTEAASFYGERALSIGESFAQLVRMGLARIAENPRLAAVWPDRPEIRRWVLSRFPYAIVYSIEAEAVLIIAIEHVKRRPGYWLARL